MGAEREENEQTHGDDAFRQGAASVSNSVSKSYFSSSSDKFVLIIKLHFYQVYCCFSSLNLRQSLFTHQKFKVTSVGTLHDKMCKIDKTVLFFWESLPCLLVMD